MSDMTERDRLAHEIAEEDAIRTFDFMFWFVGESDGYKSVSIDLMSEHLSEATWAIRYLELSGKLERHPEHNDWVRVKA